MQDSDASPIRSRTFQSIAILVAAIAQIACARLTTMLGMGVPVEVQSAATSHPLVPWAYAFSIWGAIFLFGLIIAIWQLLPQQRRNRVLGAVGWNLAIIFALNAIWEVWVPLNGFDVVSVGIILVALVAGVSALLTLRQMTGSRDGRGWIGALLGLVTGWLTAAFTVNITSMLIAGAYPLDPKQVEVSLAFLAALILVGGAVTVGIRSLVYAGTLVWALFWILMANIYRDNEPAMVTGCLTGIALIGLICAWVVARRLRPLPR